MTLANIAGLSAIALYGTCTISLIRAGREPDATKHPQGTAMRLPWAAAALHAASLWPVLFDADGVDFGFLNMAALVALFIIALVLLVSARHPADKLGIFLFPLAALLLGLRLGIPQPPHLLHNTSVPMQFHVLASILAYSILNLAAVQALLVALQDWHLRKKQPLPLLGALPSLQTMETFLFRLISAGFLLLSLSLVTGLAYVEDLFAQHLAHKTVLSILAWLVFALLLWGRAARGWRGRTAMRWTLGGFAVLMLAYFGSKIVLELILHRA
ncbi:cytochrome C assembly family protein [Methylogaea oryzae]|uniref:cytochrome C assembly family protein n=1 Tax=Methylogaea oryzae TaxID=1295382 RepID=UPI0012E2B94B|nr:cytochrome c biogenesis protein CcsA [Methylogaea oryzae]